MQKNTIFFIFAVTMLLVCAVLFGEQQPGEQKLCPGTEKPFRRASFSAKHKIMEDQEFVFPENMGKLRIPAGSLATDTAIDLCIEDESFYDKNVFKQCGKIFMFDPHGLTFHKSVYLTLEYTPPADFPEEYIHIYYFNPETMEWQMMQKVEQDKENNTITVKIHHFSDYTPGVGSYHAEEGLSPNCSYFKNNNERIDKNRGTLILTRNDIHIPGRAGLDLDISTTFNSDGYYYHYKKENDWVISSFLEQEGKYKIAKGWRFRYPFFYTRITGEDNLSYVTEDGQVYQLTNAILYDIDWGLFVYRDLEGYRIYNESYLSGNGEEAYTRVIEIIPQKTVICCHVKKINGLEIKFRVTNLHIYYPDGRIIYFKDPQGDGNSQGKIDRIYDAAKKNSISFTYRDDGKLDFITDTIGRELHFEYITEDFYKYINLYLKAGNKKYYLVQYKINWWNELEKIIYLTHDNSGPMSETAYYYSHTEDLYTKIIYPYGGESTYYYAETYCARKYSWPEGTSSKQKPMVKGHSLKKSSDTPDSETQYTSFNYYNSKGVNLAEEYPGDNVKVYKTVTILQTADKEKKQRKTETYYGYDDNALTGELLNTTYIRAGNSWRFYKTEKNLFAKIIPSYYEISKHSCYYYPVFFW